MGSKSIGLGGASFGWPSSKKKLIKTVRSWTATALPNNKEWTPNLVAWCIKRGKPGTDKQLAEIKAVWEEAIS